MNVVLNGCFNDPIEFNHWVVDEYINLSDKDSNPDCDGSEMAAKLGPVQHAGKGLPGVESKISQEVTVEANSEYLFSLKTIGIRADYLIADLHYLDGNNDWLFLTTPVNKTGNWGSRTGWALIASTVDVPVDVTQVRIDIRAMFTKTNSLGLKFTDVKLEKLELTDEE